MLMKPFPSLSNTLKASLMSPSMSESLNSLCKLKDNKPTEKSCFLKMKIISISFKCLPCHQPNKLIEADVPVPILSSKCRIGLMILKTNQDKNILKTTQDKFKESPGRLHSPGLSAPPQLATSQRFSSPKNTESRKV